MADSRFRLNPRFDPRLGNEEIQRDIYVGWDDMLGTYYAEVWDRTADGEHLEVSCVGRTIAEVTDPAAVVDVVRAYAQIPPDLADTLAASRASIEPIDTFLPVSAVEDDISDEMADMLNRIYSASGYVTLLERDDIAPLVTAHGWENPDLRLTQDGHQEVYQRGGQELAINWVWSDEHRATTRMATPIHIDGLAYDAASRQEFDSLVAQGSPELQILTPNSEQQIDGLLDRILGPQSEAPSESASGVTGPPEIGDATVDGEDEGSGDDFHTGLGH